MECFIIFQHSKTQLAELDMSLPIVEFLVNPPVARFFTVVLSARLDFLCWETCFSFFSLDKIRKLSLRC